MTDHLPARLRTAIDTADLAVLGELLAEGVLWYGSRGGACHNRDEVLAVLRDSLAAGVRPQRAELRSIGDGLLLEAELRTDAGPSTWNVAFAVNPAGRIGRMQDYESVAVAERDLAMLAQPPRDAPPAAITGLVPFVHVADVARSVAFYRLLGMRVHSTYEPEGQVSWAMLGNEGAAVMFARADVPVDSRQQGVLFYLYSSDLQALRDLLLAHAVWPGEIVDGTPGPRQEMRVIDPDGYCLMIAQLDDRPS